MTISSANRKAGPYVGNSVATVFAFSFKVFAAADLLVVKRDTATNIETTLTLTTDYTVSLNANQNTSPGGTITLVSALPTGYTMIISSQVEYLQETDLTNQGGFYPEVVTNSLDRLTILTQQLAETSSRQLAFPITDPVGTIGNLPPASDRANQYLAFDAAGNPISTFNIPSYIYQGAKAVDPTERNDGGALVTGDMYYSTATARMRVYTGSGWVDIGTPIPLTLTPQQFSGTGSQTAFTLSVAPAFQNATEVYVAGLAKVPGVDYTVSGTTLTFASAPASGTNNIYVKILSAYAAGVPDDGSVTTAKLADGAVTAAKLGSGATFPSGTLMLFQQTAAPTGWTKQTTHNDKALRVVSGTASSGGTSGFASVFANQTPTITTSGLSVGATTLSTAQMPSHDHATSGYADGSNFVGTKYSYYVTTSANLAWSSTPCAVLANGGGGSHTHSLSGSATSSAITLNVAYVDLIIASKD